MQICRYNYRFAAMTVELMPCPEKLLPVCRCMRTLTYLPRHARAELPKDQNLYTWIQPFCSLSAPLLMTSVSFATLHKTLNELIERGESST